MTSLLNSIKNLAKQTGEDTKTRFSVAPAPGDSGFTQWQNGMRMVARLPEGIPSQFRKTLWLNLAEKHLASRGVQWQQVEEFCFNEYTNPDDEELGVQIVKDVHRTGCSLFCGVSGKDNQALLKRVLLAYARWNKAVGYCQGFNMLAALILQVMDKSEVDSVKVMIYLIEGVLPESYFANSLRGLSVDMAVFRDLLRIKLPTLSRHFDQLQSDSKDSGTSYEPPLTNVFTMQWFLTLFCNCLPQDTVLRVWDLIFLEGNHILLSTALAIWSTLSDRIMTVESADEFYHIMGVLTREMLEFGLMDANALIKAIVSFNLPELPELREKYLYNITPWTQSVSTVARRGLRLFYSDDDTDTEEDDEKIAIATAYGLFRSPKRKDGAGITSPPRAVSYPDKEKIAMDISALTKQYRKLRERQKQAHVILTAACGNQSLVGPTTTPAMNHLLMGKFALVNNKGRRLGPPPGSIPPPSQPRARQGEKQTVTISGETLHWKDTADGKKTQQRDSDEDQSPEQRSRRSSSSSTSTELCDDPHRSPSDSEDLSDASGFLPSDTEPSTPKRSVQHKVQHPSDVISCKEEDEEACDKTEDEKHPPHAVLEVKQNESKSCKSLSPASLKSLSPVSSEGGEEDKLQKRKLSFRIDPEELRQLDRKLSLKIVEIERRKSSAGIESEDLNSKVLFPFDRDYIQEMEKCETPSSIPDDRMCSTEDYISGFEEETILVPDIITTHKPLGYRMASLDECDETKVNEAYGETDENVQEDLMSGGNRDDPSYMDHESPEELYEDEVDEEEATQNAYVSYNFDELFLKKDSENSKTAFEQKGKVDYLLCPGQKLKDSEINLTHDPNEQLETSSLTTINSENAKEITTASNSTTEKSCSSFQNNLYLSDDMKAGMSVSETGRNEDLSSVENNLKTVKSEEVNNLNGTKVESNRHKTILTKKEETSISSQEEDVVESMKTTHGISSTTSPNMCDSDKALEKKLASVLPKLASLSFDSSMPDVAAVASREARINSIREKYANLGQTSKEELGRNESEDFGYSNLLRFNSKTGPDSTTCIEKPELNVINVKEENSLLASSFTVKTIGILSTQETIEGSLSEIDNSTGTSMVESNLLNPNLDGEIGDELVHDTKKSLLEEENKKLQHEEEINQQISSYEEEIRPSSVSSNRRGSEVALSLILKENSQILSKMQSRRSSEVNLDQTANLERFSRTESPEESIEKRLKTDEEILSLTKAILDIEADSCKSFQLENIVPVPEMQNELSHRSRLTPELREYGVSERQEVKCSNEMLENKTPHKELKEKTEDEVTKRMLKKQEIIELGLTDKSESLPDVCKFSTDSSKSPKHRSTITSSDKFQPYLTSRLNSDGIGNDTNTNDYTVKTFKDPYNYSKRPSIMSPTTEVDENSPPEINSSLKFKPTSIDDEPILSSLKANEQPLSIQINSKTYQNSDFLKVESKSSEMDNLSVSNEDILKELRALDIKPEEVLEYTDSKVIPITPVTPEEHVSTHKKTSPIKDILKLSSEKESYDFQESSSDMSSELRTSRRSYLADHKTSSFDIAPFTKTDSYSIERHKPIVRASTTVDNDDSLYLSSYKSHGRLLIEKGELDTHKRLESDKFTKFSGKDTDTFETSRFSDRKSLNSDEESAYESPYRKVSSSRVNRSYSEFLADDSRSSIYSKTEPREKTLFKYKSEDYGRSMSPPHYRFSSASPVRKRLDHLPTDSPPPSYPSLARTKSPSPTYYGSSHSLSSSSSHSLSSSLIRSPERSGIDSTYKPSTESKRYSRTESLDLNCVEIRSTYSKKRAESLDISTSDKLSGDKKSPVSPQKFNPFPVRSSSRQPKELGVKLGLYLPQKSDKSPSKHVT